MNLFFTNPDPLISASENMDSHVVKIILEAAQMMSTVHYHATDYLPFKKANKKWPRKYPHRDIYRIEGMYLPTHYSHGIVNWLKESLANYELTYLYAKSLNIEKKFRFTDKDHASLKVIDNCWNKRGEIPWKKRGLTPIYQAMPSDVKNDCPFTAYRDYYIKYKQHLAKWTKRGKPKWYVDIGETH